MKTKSIQLFNRLYSLLIGLLGFGIMGCESSTVAEYGTPTADFKFSGKITDAATGESVSGIKVSTNNGYVYVENEDNGDYVMNYRDLPATAVLLRFEEFNPKQTGQYQKLDTLISLTDEEFKNGDGNWYLGKIEKEINIPLKKKEEAAE
ncbi:radical SAM-associated putative lipoprotein [Persicobacter sp. CCB-QB2]|uniref:radical SAM-associated putative lipoprotein n=1 Tax=Persicobacter sp. CCB-QB2 TaxID=1561025 RepID=UPI00092EA110|nr:radical SAM-associated putative lipoprotein [Persicobacter sp. CCB-QB2]